MEWTAIIGELGGGLSAVVIVALAWALWQGRQREHQLTDRLIEQSEKHLQDAVRREQDMLTTMQALETAVRGAIK